MFKLLQFHFLWLSFSQLLSNIKVCLKSNRIVVIKCKELFFFFFFCKPLPTLWLSTSLIGICIPVLHLRVNLITSWAVSHRVDELWNNPSWMKITKKKKKGFYATLKPPLEGIHIEWLRPEIQRLFYLLRQTHLAKLQLLLFNMYETKSCYTKGALVFKSTILIGGMSSVKKVAYFEMSNFNYGIKLT